MESSAALIADFSADVSLLDDSFLADHQHAPSLQEVHPSDFDLSLPLHDTSELLHIPQKIQPHSLFISPQFASDAAHTELSPENLFRFTSADADSDSVDGTSTAPTPPTVCTTTTTPSPSTQRPIRPNVSHTRRCRAKVNNNFDRLLEVLPNPPPGVEVKHKAQILQYAIDFYRHVSCKNRQLEMKLALRSPAEMYRWVQSVVSATPNLKDALKSFMAMICITKNWKYAELWAPQTRGGSSSVALRYVTGALPPTVGGEELQRLRTYRGHSRKYKFPPRTGVPGRVFLTMRPEWLPLLNDPIAFPRAPHAVRNNVEVTFAVPVIVNGAVQMIVEFYDTERRDYDPATLNMANDMAIMFGKAFTGLNSSPTLQSV
ncbi:GAF-like protein [Gracilaria domingensis]|nr:GAF-like protein [Gracilaria domingensis]